MTHSPREVAAAAAPRPYFADRWSPWMGATIVALAVGVFLPTLLSGFILDDSTVIRGNALIHSWHGLRSAWTHPYWAQEGDATRSGLYRPLLIAIFTVIWNVGHRFALWFHLFAIAAHGVASWLVWRLLKRGVGSWAAFAGALWFAAHPVHVEAIASVANVSEVLVAIAAIWLAFVVRRAADDEAQIGWRVSFTMVALFAAAALTKESGFMIPALAAVCAWGWRWPDAEPDRPTSPPQQRLATLAMRWRRPIMLGAVVFVAIVCLRRLEIGSSLGAASMAAPGLEGLSTGQRVWAMLALGPRVLRLLFWPTLLLAHYGPDFLTATGPSPAGVATLVVLAGSIALGRALARRGDRRLLTAVVWAMLAFLPASNLLVATGQILAERTLYGATIGAAMSIAWIGAYAIDASGALARMPRLAVRTMLTLAAAVPIARSARATLDYDATWRTHDALFTHLVTADPAGYRGHWLLAMQAQGTAHPDSALLELGRAYARFHGDRQLTIDYTNALLAADRPENAATVAANLMRFPDLRADSNAVGLYLSAVARAYGADSALALARVLAPGVRRPVP